MPVARRTRTYSWDAPDDLLARVAGMSGLEALQLIAAGELPPAPIAETLGFGPIEVEEGRATFTIEPAEFHYNPIGVVHGGLALALLDSAMGCAVHSTLAAGVTYTTLGYGDLVLPKPWRMLGPIEGLVGILMCGLSAGLFFATVAAIYTHSDSRK